MPIIAVIEWATDDGMDPEVLLVPEIGEARKRVVEMLSGSGYLGPDFLEFLASPDATDLIDLPDAWLAALHEWCTAPWVTFYRLPASAPYGWAELYRDDEGG